MSCDIEGASSELGACSRKKNECRLVLASISNANSLLHPNCCIREHKFQFLILWFNANIQT
jgi:hypothetical protein